ncbi:MBOAT family O-acyltransferase [Rhizobium sp. S96]|uniref:MBOAT family O-acyltransferase n=1 Tax=Rhizobium sp. S96 TaxID=3055140 RepID=UPI0025AA4C17|nr:MBOAT family O-acyltransferase [Rhizobium sp. S96]MDM9619067.1 MBOAT family O-acyltransferase [Rhizobium sp. S96]
MIFSSDAFIFLFLPIWLIIFFMFSVGMRRWLNVVILAASLLFYASWDVGYLPILIGSIVVNYAAVVALKTTKRTKPIVVAGVAFNLALLGWYKYWCFFGSMFGILSCNPASASEHLPLAISFFTFQQIAYLVDIYRHREAGRDIPHPIDYAAFVSFFPHLIAGPITRSNELLKPIEEKAYQITAKTMEVGLAVFLLGFAKKVFLADPLGQIADPIFGAAEAGALDGLSAILGVVAFTLQIYFDFSGYSEMAVGLGLMIGIQLPWNFATPYGATSVVDFWRRWHITLSTILRDYLYIALGGNRCGEVRKHVNLMATMVLGGLWHGANWTFVVWGALHGIFLIAVHLYRASKLPTLPVWLAIILTNAVVAFAWTFFRAATFSGAWNVVTSLWSAWDADAAAGHLGAFYERAMFSPSSSVEAVLICFAVFTTAYLVAATVRTQDIQARYEVWISGGSFVRPWAALVAAGAMSYGLFMQAGLAAKFIYFDF